MPNRPVIVVYDTISPRFFQTKRLPGQRGCTPGQQPPAQPLAVHSSGGLASVGLGSGPQQPDARCQWEQHRYGIILPPFLALAAAMATIFWIRGCSVPPGSGLLRGGMVHGPSAPLAHEDGELHSRAPRAGCPLLFIGVTRLKHADADYVRLTGWFNLKLLLLWRLGRTRRKTWIALLWVMDGFSKPYTMLGI